MKLLKGRQGLRKVLAALAIVAVVGAGIQTAKAVDDPNAWMTEAELVTPVQTQGKPLVKAAFTSLGIPLLAIGVAWGWARKVSKSK